VSRHADWSPVGLDADPTPGDPDLVDAAARHYRDVADAITEARDQLRKIASGPEMESQAVEAFIETTETVSEEIQRAHERYDRVATALATFAPLHADAQDRADAALRSARLAEGELHAAQRVLDLAQRDLADSRATALQAPPGTPPPDHSALETQVRRAASTRDDARARLDGAIARAAAAKRDFESAAASARRAIDLVQRTDGLNDSTWDKIAEVLKEIANVAGAIAAIAGVLALAVSWIPVIGQALAAVLGTIALVAGVVSLVANVALYAGGKGSLTNVILDVVGVATFGIGRAVIGGARAAYRGAQGVARLNAGRIAATSPAARIAAGLPGGSSASAIRSLLGGNQALSSLSRHQARSLAQSADNVPMFSLGAPFRTAWDDITGLGTNLGTAFSPTNIATAFRDGGDALRAIRGSDSIGEALARISGNGDALRHLDFAGSIHSSVRTGDLFAQADLLTAVGNGATFGAGALDHYQFANAVSGVLEPGASETLGLADEGAKIP